MNHHAILCKYHGPTNFKGSRVSFHSLHFGDRLFVALDSRLTMRDFIVTHLASLGYSKLLVCETEKGYIVVTPDFEPLTLRARAAKAARRAAIG